MSDLRQLLKVCLDEKKLPSHDELLCLIDSVVSLLEDEDESYRPQELMSNGDILSGGLLDFSLACAEKMPLVVVPDIHARGKFIIDLLDYVFPSDFYNECGFDLSGKDILSLLESKKIRVVCVGDAFHSEMRGMERWNEAFKEFRGGNYTGSAMTDEMRENISILKMLILLKKNFPENFHFLKGNHENILNANNHGDHSFRKFADEGNMVYEFLRETYGDALLHVWSCWEHALPLCAVFSECVVSHAEPARTFTRKEIISYRENPDVVEGLTWTDNFEAEKDSVESTLVNLLGAERAKNAVWFGGHRPIDGKYVLRQNGKYIQIHNPEMENVAIVIPDKIFEVDRDIITVE